MDQYGFLKVDGILQKVSRVRLYSVLETMMDTATQFPSLLYLRDADKFNLGLAPTAFKLWVF